VREAGGVEHGAEVVDLVDEVVELLADAGVVGVPEGVAEDVGGVEDVIGRERGVGFAEEGGDGFDAVGFVGGAGEDEFGGGVGEADVVELDLVEAGFGGLDSDGDVVGADLGFEGIGPGEAFAGFAFFSRSFTIGR